MFSPLVVLAAFAASVSAITIISPNPSQGWTNDGAQSITWQAVDSDPKNFTILLLNDATNVAPVPQQLAALVVTSLNKIDVNPPATGWPAPGTKYRIKFVADAEHLNSQLCQSDEFAIRAPALSSGSSTLPSTPVLPPTSPGASQPTDGTPSDSGAPTPTNSGALPGMSLQTSLVGALVVLGAFLAQF
ncbi:hypothetical protein R3P38DRAFT_2832130 [Favolaschia claudopus]|uniref:Yeast cell wall synthesis Kre9/Knh1-like N-terminal domain-containing protein n=1 Tax=Favolaschia claudopus TaxID=2862362 RepID=A0AAW0EC36_9AGAR